MASLAEIKARLQKLNSRQKGKNDLWKAKDEHQLRLLPNPKGGDPFEVLVFHYEMGETVLCPKANFDEECVICEFADALKAWKDAKGQDKPENVRKADFEIFKKIQPKEKAFVRVIERNKDTGKLSEEGAKWWAPGFTNTNKILEFCGDSDRAEALGLEASPEGSLDVMFSTSKAYELKVSFKKKLNSDGKGNTKNQDITEIKDITLKSLPLGANKAEIDKIIASCKPLGEVYTRQTSEEVKTIFDKYIGENSTKEAEPEGGTEYPSNSAEKPPVSGTKSLEEAFGELASE